MTIPEYLQAESEILHDNFYNIWVEEFQKRQIKSTFINWVKVLKDIVKKYSENLLFLPNDVSPLLLYRLTIRLLSRMIAFSEGMIDITDIKEHALSFQDPIINMLIDRFYSSGRPDNSKIIQDIKNALSSDQFSFENHEYIELYMNILTLLMKEGKISEGMKYYYLANEKYREIEKPSPLLKLRFAQISEFVAYDLNLQGHTDGALETLNLSYDLAKEISDFEYLGVIENTYFYIYYSLGNFKEAMIHLDRSREYYNQIGVLESLQILISQGALFMDMGNFSEARKIFYRIKEIFIKEKKNLILPLINLAIIDLREGKIEDSINILQKLWDENNSDELILEAYKVNILLHLIKGYIKIEQFQEANKYLMVIKEKITEETIIWNLFYKYLLGLYELKRKNIGVAKKILLDAVRINLKVNDFGLGQEIFLVLVDTILLEYKISQSEQDFMEALSYINCVVEDCIAQNYIVLLIDSLYLRSLLFLTQNRKEESKNDLEKIIELDQKYHILLEDKKSEIMEQLINLKHKEFHKKSIWEKMTAGIKKIMKRSISVQPKVNGKSKIFGILILESNAGLPIYDEFFNKKIKTNPVLISGLLSAVHSFTSALISSQGMLQGIKHQDIDIIIDSSSVNVHFVLFVEKENPIFRKSLTVFSRIIQQYYGNLFEKGPINEKLPENEVHKIVHQVFHQYL